MIYLLFYVSISTLRSSISSIKRNGRNGKLLKKFMYVQCTLYINIIKKSIFKLLK